jgi:hypothetical protein
MSSRFPKILGSVLFLVFLPFTVSAQQGTAIIQGSVVDQSGGVLPGAAVTVRNEETGVSRSTVTDSVGHYRFPALQSGIYTIRIEQSGFSVEERKAVQLIVGDQVVVDFTMKVGTVTETVEVGAGAVLVDTQQSQVEGTIDQKEVRDLPLLSRNFLGLAALVPGAGRNTSVTGTQPLQIGGADSRYNYTTVIDGGDIDDDIWGAPVMNIDEDSIKEFKVVTNRFDAEYGGALEAALNVVTKSGTNDYHGSGYGFFRADPLRARNYFEQVKAPFDQQRAGGTFGGPLVHDKTFFFIAYEYLHVNSPLTVAIPESSPLSQYNGSFSAGNTSNLLNAHFDHQLSKNNSLMVRGLYEHDNSEGGFGGTFAQSFGVKTLSTSYSIMVQETATLNPHIVNNLRYQFRVTDVHATPNSTAPTEIFPSGTIGAAYYYSEETRHRHQIYDTMYFSLPKHNIKVGGNVTFMQTGYCACAEQPGLFVFATDGPFNPADPSTYPVYFEISINPSARPLPDKYFGMFGQDDWRITKRLTLSLGLRWDVDMRVRDNQTMEEAFTLPRNQSLRGVLSEHPGVNFGSVDPRFGFAYSPSSNTVVRGGFGIYHARARMFMQELALQQLTGDNFFAEVTDPAQLAYYPDINKILGGHPTPAGPTSMSNVIANNFQLPYAYNATFGVTRQFGENTALKVDGVYSHSLHDFERRIINLPPTFSASNPAGTAANPYLYGFGQIQAQVTDGMTWYSALQVGLTHRLSHRLQGQVSYTYSHAIQLGADAHYYTPSQPIGGIDRGPTTNDMRHKGAVAAIGTLPWGLQLSTIIVGNTAPPYNIVAGIDVYGDGTTCCARPPGLGLNQGGNASQNNLNAINTFRATYALTPVTADQLGHTYAFVNFDMRLAKTVQLGEHRSLEFMAELFNLFNHPNFDAPNATAIATTFLTLSSAEPSREAQFGARFSF